MSQVARHAQRAGNAAELQSKAATSSALSVETVGDYFVFDIGGNKFRIIAAIHFNTQKLYVRHVLTHAEYDQWRAK